MMVLNKFKDRKHKLRKKDQTPLGAGIALVLWAGYTTTSQSTYENASVNPPIQAEQLTHAIAVLTPTEGNTAEGIVRFVQDGSSVKINANITGLEPNSIHAWHIHEYGNISGADAKATGGHYNPENLPHGLPNNPNRHAGDLGNLKADANGQVQKELTINNVTINETKNPILGRGLIVHAESDDGGQPSGNAGARIAQGVIGVDNTP